MSIVTLWKQNPGISILLLGMLAASLIPTVLPAGIIQNYITQCDYSADVMEEAIPDETEPVAYEEPFEEIADESDEDLCDWLSGADNCADNVEAALQFAVRYYSDNATPDGTLWRNDLQVYFAGEENTRYRNFVALVQFTKTYNTLLTKLFDTYEYLIYKTVSRDLYQESAASRLVTLLNHIYDELYLHGNGDRTCERIYDLMWDNDDWSYSEYRNHLKSICLRDEALIYFNDYFNDDNSPIYHDDLVVWAYSFWGRRYHEGNVQATHYILQKIANHYE
jgi:hypothetical protein